MQTITRLPRTDQLAARLATITTAGATTLADLAGRAVRVETDSFATRTGEQLLERVAEPILMLRAEVTGQHGSIGFLVGRRDAITWACLARPNAPDHDVLRRRHAAVLERRDVDALHDVGWLLGDRGDRVLRQMTGERAGLAFREVAALTPQSRAQLLPPSREHGVLALRIAFAGLPPTELTVIADPAACDVLDTGDHALRAVPAERAVPAAQPKGPMVRAFLDGASTFPAVLAACGRLGVELEGHAATTAPNPSAIRDGIVVLELPPGERQHLEWCARLKQASPEVQVAMLVHQPTRARVLQAFEARADAVIAWPAEPLEIAIRLRNLTSR